MAACSPRSAGDAETLIAIVALIGAKEGADDVAIGAIVGAPFCSHVAMGLVGSSPISTGSAAARPAADRRPRPPQGARPLFFLVFFALSLALAWGRRMPSANVGVLSILAYPIYIHRTLRTGVRCRTMLLDPLIFEPRRVTAQSALVFA